MSFKKHFAWAVLLLGGLSFASADVIQLKDQAAVTGKILAEKPDAVVVDVGYTVLVVPRSVIAGVSKSGPVVAPAPAPAPAASSNPVVSVNTLPQFYYSDNRPAAARDMQDLVKQLGEAVVQVRTPGGLGSGFFINADGYLITNFHVIEGETEISVEVYHQHDGQLDRETYKQVKIIAINKFHDLALLKIEDKNATKFKFVTLGSSDALSVGDSVFAIGSPLGLERTVTAGILSTKTRQIEGELYLQTTAQINPGNSGGPLFNLRRRGGGRDEHENHLRRGPGLCDPHGAGEEFSRPSRRLRLFQRQSQQSLSLSRAAGPHQEQAGRAMNRDFRQSGRDFPPSPDINSP